MSDTRIDRIIQYGTEAERAAFTPSPPASIQTLYLWYATDTLSLYAWDGAAWQLVAGNLFVPALLTADPASPADDTWWLKRSAATPFEITLNVRIGGVTTSIPLATIP